MFMAYAMMGRLSGERNPIFILANCLYIATSARKTHYLSYAVRSGMHVYMIIPIFAQQISINFGLFSQNA